MVFSVVMYGRESWTIKKAEHWRTDAFELWCWRRFESPLDCKEIQPVHPKGNQFWVFIRTDVEAETPVLCPPVVKSWLLWKDPDAGKDFPHPFPHGRRRGWQRMRWLDGITNSNGHEFEHAPGDGEGLVSLACYNPWGHRVGQNWVTEQQQN